MKSWMIATLVLMLVAGAAISDRATAAQSADDVPPEFLSISDLNDADGNLLGYAVVMQDSDGKVGIAVVARGLTQGKHGIHVHETGNCDPAGEKTFEQAGGHFNPGHGVHPTHAGDLGNLIADEDGETVFSTFTSEFELGDNGPTLRDADGSALIVHADVDDLVTDPSGNSGARIACAVLFAPQ